MPLVSHALIFSNMFLGFFPIVTYKDDTLKITYRPVCEEDIEFLHKVYASTREAELALTDWSDQQKEDFTRMQFDLQHKQWMQNYGEASFDIVYFEETPVGRLYVNRRKNEIRIIDIALLTAFRRKGIGSKIMHTLIDEADQRGCPLSLHVEKNNPALNLYQKLGFQVVDDIGVYYLLERSPGNKN